MFYLKDLQGNFIQTEGEIYSQCPECGKLHLVVNLVEVIKNCSDFDPYKKAVYCLDCSNKWDETGRAVTNYHEGKDFARWTR